MKKQRQIHLAIVNLLCLCILSGISCTSSKENYDMQAPRIDLEIADAFPQACAQLPRGQVYQFKARFVDNTALGSFSLDIHNNFNQHSHSTEDSHCEFEAKKTPIKPHVYIESFSIPEGKAEYQAEVAFEIPEDVDLGDYHFSIMLTDAAGWTTRKSLHIKIVE